MDTDHDVWVWMKNLKKGWNGYTAEAPDSKAIENARLFSVYTENRGLKSHRISPSSVGGVGISFRKEPTGKFAYVEFYNEKDNCDIYALFSNPGYDISSFKIDLDHKTLDNIVDRIKKYLEL